MARIKEEFVFTFKDKTILVKHDGLKPFSEQGKAFEDLKTVISDELRIGKEYSFIPYNNFECSVEYKVVPNHDITPNTGI